MFLTFFGTSSYGFTPFFPVGYVNGVQKLPPFTSLMGSGVCLTSSVCFGAGLHIRCPPGGFVTLIVMQTIWSCEERDGQLELFGCVWQVDHDQTSEE